MTNSILSNIDRQHIINRLHAEIRHKKDSLRLLHNHQVMNQCPEIATRGQRTIIEVSRQLAEAEKKLELMKFAQKES